MKDVEDHVLEREGEIVLRRGIEITPGEGEVKMRAIEEENITNVLRDHVPDLNLRRGTKEEREEALAHHNHQDLRHPRFPRNLLQWVHLPRISPLI